jgi:DNA polymerase elongation subunit (family B)
MCDDSDHHVFQVISWTASDLNNSPEDQEDAGSNNVRRFVKTYTIKMYGRDSYGNSITVTIPDWKPYFFIKLDHPVSAQDIRTFIQKIYRAENGLTDTITDAKVVKRKDFWGFSNDKKFHFLRMCFRSEMSMKMTAMLLAKSSPPITITRDSDRCKLYESNIIPYLRFCHVQDIQPAGWVKIPKTRCEATEVLESKCATDVQVDSWKHVQGIVKTEIAPLRVLSFDIECVSSDGDFPVACKTYTKVANDIFIKTQSSHKEPSAAWRTMVADVVMEKFSSGSMIPFDPHLVSEERIRGLIKQHSPHLWLLTQGDVSVLDHEVKRIFSETLEASSHRAQYAFFKFVDRLKGDGKTSAISMRGSLTRWLQKVFGVVKSKLQKDRVVETIVGIVVREKEALVCLLGSYLDSVLPKCKGDPIIQIGCTIHNYGDKDCTQKILLSNGTCDDIPDTQVIQCHSESIMLQKWVDLINAIDPDVLTGYNILGFDFNFIHDRAKELGVLEYLLCNLGRLKHVGKSQETLPSGYTLRPVTACRFVESKLSSSALGDNLMYYFDMPGRVVVDILKVVQRDHKLDSYKLDLVANHFMNENKKDVSPNDIFRLYRGTASDRAIIGDYCVMDCELCNRLIMKLEILANNIGMSNVCFVPLHFIFFRGQGVKIFSLVARQARDLSFVIPHIISDQDDFMDADDLEEMEIVSSSILEDHSASSSNQNSNLGYEGAIVLDPIVGLHTTPVAVLDYASLYPSSMISENLSHDCLVLDEEYDNIPGVEYLDVTYDIYEGKGDTKIKTGEKVCRFAQNRKGVLPQILEHLLQQRKLTRKRMTMKTAALIHGGETVDGYLNAKTNRIVTTDGKDLSTITDIVEGSIRNTYNPFQLAVLEGLQLAYKVTANSLYGQQGAVTSPLYLKDIAACTTATGRKMILLAKNFLEQKYDGKIVYGDSVTGYTPVYVKKNGMVELITIDTIANRYGNDTWIPCVEQGKQEKEACELRDVETWTEQGWTKLHRVIRHELAPHKRIVRVLTHTGLIDVTDDHSLLDKNGAEVTPKDVSPGFELLHHEMPSDDGERMKRELLWARVCDTYGHEDEDGVFHIDQKSQVSAACLAWLASSLGYHISLDTPRDSIYRITVTKSTQQQHKNPISIKKMDEIDYVGYVYDLTTDNHHFAAGVGQLIVHNTDSVFVQFPKQTKGTEGKDALAQTISTAKDVSDKIKPLLKAPHDLEYEKTYYPLILLSKKRYVANTYGSDTNSYKRNSMGIVMKRRDNAPIVKHLYGGIIDNLLNHRDPVAAAEFLHLGLNELIEGKRPLSDLVISKSLRASYKDPSKIAHKVLADRMAARDPGSAPEVNSRLPYVYIVPEGNQLQTQKVLQGDRIEHVDYVREKGLSPDYEFYITNQIMSPILQLLAIVLEDLPEYSLKSTYWKLKRKELCTTRKATTASTAVSMTEKQIADKLQDLRETEVKKLIFDPILKKLRTDPTRIRAQNKQNGNRTITDFCIKK